MHKILKKAQVEIFDKMKDLRDRQCRGAEGFIYPTRAGRLGGVTWHHTIRLPSLHLSSHTAWVVCHISIHKACVVHWPWVTEKSLGCLVCCPICPFSLSIQSILYAPSCTHIYTLHTHPGNAHPSGPWCIRRVCTHLISSHPSSRVRGRDSLPPWGPKRRRSYPGKKDPKRLLPKELQLEL